MSDHESRVFGASSGDVILSCTCGDFKKTHAFPTSVGDLVSDYATHIGDQLGNAIRDAFSGLGKPTPPQLEE